MEGGPGDDPKVVGFDPLKRERFKNLQQTMNEIMSIQVQPEVDAVETEEFSEGLGFTSEVLLRMVENFRTAKKRAESEGSEYPSNSDDVRLLRHAVYTLRKRFANK